MAAREQRQAAKENIRKTQKAWQQKAWQMMSSQKQPSAELKGKARSKPGVIGGGKFFRVIVRDQDQFKVFRYQDVGKEGHIERLAGRRETGSWATHAWLISKDDAHIENEKLVPDTQAAKDVIEALRTKPRHLKGDFFQAKDRPNGPEKNKPTTAQRRPRRKNFKKAPAARSRH